MVYVDEMTNCIKNKNWPYLRSCHLIADKRSELHIFAKGIGLKRSWFREKLNGKIPHYDLTTNKRSAAVHAGAIEIDAQTFVCRIRAFRLVWATEEYIDAKAALVHCQQNRMKIVCIRCARYKSGLCETYKKYFDTWMCLQANLKHYQACG